jgi:hypothetical protein
MQSHSCVASSGKPLLSPLPRLSFFVPPEKKLRPGLTGSGPAVGGADGAAHSMLAPKNAGIALRGTGINGTTMGRMATGPGLIGGPARDYSGINGTLIRPKQH